MMKTFAQRPETIALAIAGLGMVLLATYSLCVGEFVFRKAGLFLVGPKARLAASAELLLGILVVVGSFRSRSKRNERAHHPAEPNVANAPPVRRNVMKPIAEQRYFVLTACAVGAILLGVVIGECMCRRSIPSPRLPLIIIYDEAATNANDYAELGKRLEDVRGKLRRIGFSEAAITDRIDLAVEAGKPGFFEREGKRTTAGGFR